MIEVDSFISRIEEGFTEPFLCGGVDGHNYIVKSARAGRNALIREYLCACIGRELGLPIPPIEIVYTQGRVAKASAISEMSDLVDVPAFASRQMTTIAGDYSTPSLSKLNASDVDQIDEQTRLQVLLFDWWVLNGDRLDGNTNLLWNAATRALHVIDHNLGIDRFCVDDFWNSHIFRADRAGLSEADFRAEHNPKMRDICAKIAAFSVEMPSEWLDECTITFKIVDEVLRRMENDAFWSE